MLHFLFLAAYTYMFAACVAAPVVNNFPIVGILSLPAAECDSALRAFPEAIPSGATSCFNSFYQQWLASAGIRSALLPFDATTDELDALLAGVNGVLFTGGELFLSPNNPSPYYKTAEYIFSKVVAANDAGDFFPLWGTCQGFQLLCMLAAGTDVLSRNAFDAENIGMALNLTPNATVSRMFSTMPTEILSILTTEPVTANLHHDGVTPASYTGSAPLTAFFDMLSTNFDRKGKEFVSTMEAFKYPIYGTQWHPERPQYDWTLSENITHTGEAIRAMQYVGEWFAQQVRLNGHQFPNATAEAASLLFNYQTVSPGHDSTQIYFFP